MVERIYHVLVTVALYINRLPWTLQVSIFIT